jgi:DNA repair exonuclease SbcCD ATPase subunit
MAKKENGMNIVELIAQNVLKLKLVRIKPDGSSVVIGGKNGNGKTSVLNCIMMALGGKKYIPKKPVHGDEKKGSIEIDLGEYTVKRTFTEAGGSAVYVENKDGARFQSPQVMLDKLIGAISFDPLAFAKLGDQGSSGVKQQLEILKQVSGVDTSKLDTEHTEVYDERTLINRDIKTIEGQLEAITVHDDAPAELVSVVELSKELDAANETNTANQKERDKVVSFQSAIDDQAEEITDIEEQIKELQGQLETYKTNKLRNEEWIKDNKPAIDALVDIDLDEIREKISTSEATNAKVNDNQEHARLSAELDDNRKKADKKTARLTAIQVKKKEMIAGSKLPVSDLIFDESGIKLNEIPFEQASEAEKLKVSVALGLAMNPKLKVLLIRDGSLLDAGNLSMISKMAEDAGGQIWIERVGDGEEMTVILEDGEVKE